MEAADGMGGELHRFAHLGIERLLGRIEIGLRRGNFGRLDGRLVELARKTGERLIAFASHRRDDRPHLLLEGRQVGLGALQELRGADRRKLSEFVEIDFGVMRCPLSERSKRAAVDGKADAGDIAGRIGARKTLAPTRSSSSPKRCMGILASIASCQASF